MPGIKSSNLVVLSRKSRRVILLIVAVVMTGLGLGGLAWATAWWKDNKTFEDSASWPQVPARIDSLDLPAEVWRGKNRYYYEEWVKAAEKRGADGYHWQVTCRYTYVHEGKKYAGIYDGWTWAKELVTSRDAGEAVDVWVNPENPDESLLVREKGSMFFLVPGMLGFLASFMGFICWAGLVKEVLKPTPKAWFPKEKRFYYRTGGKSEEIGQVIGVTVVCSVLAITFAMVAGGWMSVVAILIAAVVWLTAVLRAVAVLRSKKEWEYRIEDGQLTVKTPTSAVGKDVAIHLSGVTSLIIEHHRSGRGGGLGSGGGIVGTTYKLEDNTGHEVEVPEGGGVYMAELVEAIMHINPGVKKTEETI